MLQVAHPARSTDPLTSHLAADSIIDIASGQRLALLNAYISDHINGGDGLTDHESSLATGIESSHKRCAELRHLGLIVATHTRRDERTGRLNMVCVPASGGSPIPSCTSRKVRPDPRTVTVGVGQSHEIRDSRGRIIATVHARGDGLFLSRVEVAYG